MKGAFLQSISLWMSACFLLMVGCSTSKGYQKMAVEMPIKREVIPAYARSMSIVVEATSMKSWLEIAEVKKLLTTALGKRFPHLRIVGATSDSDIQIHCALSAKRTRRSGTVKEMRFRHNLAHLPYYETAKTEFHRFSYSLEVAVVDSQAKYKFFEKRKKAEVDFDGSNERAGRAFIQHIVENITKQLLPKTHHREVQFINIERDDPLAKFTRHGQFDEALRLLNEKIDRLRYVETKRLIAELERLGIYYYNRAQLLQTLNRDKAGERDLKRAKLILRRFSDELYR